MGRLLRDYDWSLSTLGAPERWPQSLKTAVRIMLTSRQPIWIGWGPDLIFFYNDPYKSIIGGKHPWAHARPTREVWREIWEEIGPMLSTALEGHEGIYTEAKLLIMERNGYPEETYYTFSYSPVPDDHGGTGGIICANSDDTGRVLSERQLTLLRELATATGDARTWRQACDAGVRALGTNPHDVPFAVLYAGAAGAPLERVAACGIGTDHPAAPAALDGAGNPIWPYATLGDAEMTIVPDLTTRFDIPLPSGPWSRPPSRAAIVRIAPPGDSARQIVLVAALNPWRLVDDRYRQFLSLVAGQLASAIGYAEAYDLERQRAEALAELDRAKTTFFSNISHEFRTPLTLMLGPLEELLNGPAQDPDATHALIEITHRNGLRLLKLVNALLDFSRIESGRIDLHRVPVDIGTFTAELASLFRSTIERAGLELIVDYPASACIVVIDTEMWEKVVLNLVSNAFKFTLSGRVEVHVVPARDGASVDVIVADTGIGMAASELPRVFERFHRVAGAEGRTIEGSGIGLALVHELVRLLGGAIRVESEPGVGTRFIVTMPTASAAGIEVDMRAPLAGASIDAHEFVVTAQRWLADHRESGMDAANGGARSVHDSHDRQASHGDRAATRTEDGASVATTDAQPRARVLVADDNADLRDYIRRILGAAGYRVAVASDGQHALELVEDFEPDLVLSDVMMPRLNGFGLLRTLRAHGRFADVPVLLLSARAGEEATVGGLEAGAEDYLVKPFSARELLARVASNLQLSKLRRETARLFRDAQFEIVERKKVEATLRTFNETLEQRVAETVAERDRLWETSEDLLAIADFDGHLIRVSPSWTRTLGFDEHALLRTHYLEFSHPDDVATVASMLASLREHGRPVHIETRMRVASGAWKWIAWTLSVERDRSRLHGVGRDVTADRASREALRRAEEALRVAQKMEAIGQLTGGVAHDFNNLLQVIGGNLQLLVKDVAGMDKPEQRVRNALAGVARGAKLSSQLLAFGRRQPLVPKVVNLGRFVRGLDDMLRRALGDGIEIETIVSGGLWNTLVDPSQVENALLNLAINARDAMQGHGRLTIEAGNAVLDDAYVAMNQESTPGRYVMLAVTDTGMGISPEIVDRVFEPFFTTKPEGQGTGLGLSMVYGFVRQSGGHVKLYSEVGQGTTVRLYLPRVRQQEDLVTETDSGPITGGTETVLVAEDDEDVRRTVVELLSELGYRVLRSKDAQSALAIIESGVPIDLLFTDVVMPGAIRSPELARKARERLPHIAVLFTSGYTDNAIVHGGRLDEGIELLSKPYSREALARKIRQVLRHSPRHDDA
ncbi:response regulator [Pararobbsia silviterrae]|uniref:histidine kinase n=2 Tax=Pararobbsia silviterrae TaxID=1792498 RepID=A0A494XCK4_9BURK|nr:response regulator [Pararobbsia silviterrae]